MTKILKTTDNARATLASGISAAATTIALTTGQGTQMPQAKFGTASSAGTSTVLNDTGDLAFLSIGDIIANHTDGSWAIVTATGTNSVTTTPLIGGTDNTWQNSDEWRYNEFVATLTNETVNPNGTITTNKREKVLVKNVATDTLTVVRGYDSSTAQTFSANDYCNIFSVSVINDGVRDALSDIRRQIIVDKTAVDLGIDNLANSQLTHATCTNTGNAYTLTCNAIIDAYVTGMRISFNPSANNTGIATVNLNGLGVKTIKKFATVDLSADDLKSGIPMVIIYDGANFQMQSFTKNISYTPGIAVLQTTRAINAATGSVNIAHGLGVTPSYIQVIANYTHAEGTNYIPLVSVGFYNGTINRCSASFTGSVGPNPYPPRAQSANTNDVLYALETTGASSAQTGQSALATFDATNITLSFTKLGAGSLSNDIYITVMAYV